MDKAIRSKLWFDCEADATAHRREHGTGGRVLGRYLFVGDWAATSAMLDSDEEGTLR